MSKDLRELLQKEVIDNERLSINHRNKFKAKLQAELHSSQNNRSWLWKVAASLLVIIGLGSSLFYFSNNMEVQPVKVAKIESLGSISPELKNIENYYLASIQTEISNLDETPENKELLDGYLEKVGELTADYKLLTIELNEEGLNEKTINALIDNLQLRLKLLYQLREQLNELNKLNVSENESTQI